MAQWIQAGAGGVLMGLVAVTAMARDPAPAGVRLLKESPGCVQARLGRVSASLGSKEPNQRTGMAPATVSYRRAFAKLVTAAKGKGADAVVLRGHEADYVAKGAKFARRPTYLFLEGAAVRLDPSARSCPLVVIDPVEFERGAIQAQRQDVSVDMGKSF